MSGIKASLTAALLMASVSVAHAGENAPFIYLATQDPFVSPEAPNAKNDIHVFGGVFAGGSFGSVVQFWDADYTDNFMIGGIYGRDFKDLGAGFVLGGVAGAAIRFGDDDDTSGELWAGLRIRHHGLVIGDLAIAPGFTAGLSVVTGPTEIERAREIHYDGDASFLGFLGPEVAFKLRQAPHVEFVYQLHHRSGADGTFGDFGEGSNASTFGLRYRF
ncbi:hypothetical protein [Manganibacter manganicus]|uniref:Outer membrane protein beta-barrel domain-containing protein n=1 Tax=Manganibacter manganicus TaxID=1873176 RepID=A0A1V8RN66_9HYPH|nr:hypothetical protein [Pseudaminobacter manganicus]OQM74596.1 hypothetical protein BFN67_21150 [Pseudaminobacter manganicus]